MLLVHFPAISGPESFVSTIAASYLDRTGSWQSWNMFYTIPHYHYFDLDIVAHAQDGDTRVFGPILPGLRQHDGFIRNTLFFTYALDLDSYHLPRYLQQVCREIRAQGFPAASIELRTHVQQIRNLDQIEQDRIIAENISEIRRRANCLQTGASL